jgi:hypothetical protein
MTIVQVYWYIYICKLFIGQLKEWLNKHTETSFFSFFLLHPLVKAYYHHKNVFFSFTAIQARTTQYKISIRWCNSSKEREDLTQKEMLSLGSAACVCRHRRCSITLSITCLGSSTYIYIYVCTQVIDKRRRQRERSEREHCSLLLLTQ